MDISCLHSSVASDSLRLFIVYCLFQIESKILFWRILHTNPCLGSHRKFFHTDLETQDLFLIARYHWPGMKKD